MLEVLGIVKWVTIEEGGVLGGVKWVSNYGEGGVLAGCRLI